MSSNGSVVLTKTRWVTIKECWFGPDASGVPADLQTMRQWPEVTWQGASNSKHTLVIPLDRPLDGVLASFKKDTQYEIRRAQSKDGLLFAYLKHPTNQDLLEFADFFDGFAEQKKLGSIDRAYLQAVLSSGCLRLTKVTRADLVLVWHSYLVVGDRVRLLHSASQFREPLAESGFRSLVGRANRWLHWQDMQKFSSENIRLYDFGGWYAGVEDTEKLRINAFKEEFGGVAVHEFDGQVPLTIKGRAYLWFRRLRGVGK